MVLEIVNNPISLIFGLLTQYRPRHTTLAQRVDMARSPCRRASRGALTKLIDSFASYCPVSQLGGLRRRSAGGLLHVVRRMNPRIFFC